MKKNTLFLLFLPLLLFCSAFFPNNVYAAGVSIDITNFPNAAFRTYVKNNFDTNSNDILDDDEAQSVTVLPVGFTYSVTSDDYGKVSITQSNSSFTEAISNFTGIEHFVNLEAFSCQNNALSFDLDLSQNVALKALFCNNTKIKSLDLMNNSELLYLDCSNNQITGILDLGENKKLLYLDCANNQITDIFFFEPLPSASKDTTPLAYIKCDHNQLKNIDLMLVEQTLLWLKCNDNRIKGLDGKFFASDAPNLIWFECDNNQIISLDLDMNRNLRYMKCNNNKLFELDLILSQPLETVICDNNRIRDLYLPRRSTTLVHVSCSSNDIELLDIAPACLQYLDFSKNKVESAHFLTSGTSLKEVNCSDNKLETIDLSKLTLLEIFYCDNNSLVDISFKNNPLLKTFSGSSQKVYGQRVFNNNDKNYPYAFDLRDVMSSKSDLSRVTDIAVLSADNSAIKYQLEDAQTLILADKPASIKYKYYFTGQLKNSYLDVTLFFSEAPSGNNYGAGNGSSIGGSGGGCNSGFVSGITALSLLIVLKKKNKRF